MNHKEHAEALGRIVGHLQALETLLRCFLYNNKSTPHTPMASGQSLDNLNVGDVVDVNALTDYDSLNRLIDRYNAIITLSNPSLVVDRSIVIEIRDALAHGRTSTFDPTKPLKLIKFDRPSAGKTTVTYSEKMSKQWFSDKISAILQEYEKVMKASGAKKT